MYGYSPQDLVSGLHFAVESNDTTETARLLRLDADINAPRDNLTPLMKAAARGYTGIVRMLIDAGAKAGVKNKQGLTAAQIAEQSGNADVAQMLQLAAKPRLNWPHGFKL